MQTTKATRLLFIIPFLLLAGCQEEPKPIAYQLVCKTDPNSAIAEAEAFNREFLAISEFAREGKTSEPYVKCIKAFPIVTRSYIFEADVFETKKGVAGETYQGCELESGELVELSNEWPMTISGQYLTFERIEPPYDFSSKVDRRTLKLHTNRIPRNMSCELKDISDDFAI